MKHKLTKLGILLMSLALITGCSNSIGSSLDDSSFSSESSFNSSDKASSESSFSSSEQISSGPSSDSGNKEEPVINEHLLNDLEDNFLYSKGSYISKAKNSAKVFTSPLSTGEISTTLNYKNNTGEHYLIFNHDKLDNSYNGFGVNNRNKLELVHFDGTELIVNKAFDNVIDNEIDLKIKMYELDDVFELFLDGEKIYSSNLNITENKYVGLYTSSDETKFAKINMDTDPFKELNKYENYSTKYGSSVLKDGGIQMTGSHNLVVPEDVSLFNGSFEVTINAQDSGKNPTGIVFRMDDQGKAMYYKNNVPCYFLYTGISGSLMLIKHPGDGTSQSIKYYVVPFYQIHEDHKLKVVLNDGLIHVYFDDVYCFGYEDEDYLTGDKIGLVSTDNNGFFKNLKVVPTDDILVKEIDKYDVVSGEFISTQELTYSTKNQSMLVSKEKIPTNGTLKVNIGTIDKHGHGLVFRLSKPNVSSYYQSEEGLSYYFVEDNGNQYYRLGRVENGNVTYSKNSFVATSLGHSGEQRIVMDGNYIYVYFANRLVIKYYDENPLMGEYYGYRCSSKMGLFQGKIEYSESTKLDTADYLIFGHSYTHWWLDYKENFKELGDSILDVGIGGARTLHYVTTASEMATYNPKWGICWNGINDIMADVSVSTLPTNMETTMLTIKEANPNFQCVIIGVNRCTKDKAYERNDKIHEANVLYEELCNKYDWLHYLDVEYLFCDNEGIPQNSWFIDTLHPTLAAYEVVSELVVDIIKANS